MSHSKKKNKIDYPRSLIGELEDHLASHEEEAYFEALKKVNKMSESLNKEYRLDSGRMVNDNVYFLNKSERILKENNIDYPKRIDELYNSIRSILTEKDI